MSWVGCCCLEFGSKLTPAAPGEGQREATRLSGIQSPFGLGPAGRCAVCSGFDAGRVPGLASFTQVRVGTAVEQDGLPRVDEGRARCVARALVDLASQGRGRVAHARWHISPWLARCSARQHHTCGGVRQLRPGAGVMAFSSDCRACIPAVEVYPHNRGLSRPCFEARVPPIVATTSATTFATTATTTTTTTTTTTATTTTTITSIATAAFAVAAGRWLLATGCWALLSLPAAGCCGRCRLRGAGCWPLVAGRWLLATGCWLLECKDT